MKKLTALLLAGLMVFALCACTGGGAGSGTGTGSSEFSADIPEGKAIPDDAVLNVTTTSHASWPYNENWKVWQYIKDSIGGTVNVTAIPSADFGTKFPLIMASRDMLPDVIGFMNKPGSAADYCEQGAFVALDDYAELLPDYTKFWESLPDDEQWMKDTRKGIDGKIYFTPIYGMERSKNIRAWLYRKDIFEKHNLKTPETIDELYEVCKQLKAIYPDSYPFCLRSGLNNISVMGSSWKPNYHYDAYYDFENEKWCYGAAESEIMYDIVVFLKKMVDEQLLPADFFTISANSWQELVSTDRGFIMPEYQIRIDFFNDLARASNPAYTMAATKPPVANNGLGVAMVNKYNNDPTGMMVPNTGNEESIANAMRYVNWFYSDAGSQVVSWGKEGETYEEIDGKKRFIYPEGQNNAQILYGFQTIGAYLRIDPKAAEACMSEEQAATTDFALEHTYPELDPTSYISFSSAESKAIADYNTTLKTFVSENIQKFVLGQRPLTEWDAFQAELSALPINELLSIYEGAYNRVK